MEGEELVIDQTGPDFMLDQLESYLKHSSFADLSIQCREKLISSAHCAVLAAVSPFLKKLFSHHRSLPYPAGQPVSLLLPEASFADVSRLLQLVYLGRVSFKSEAERRAFMDLLKMLNISEKILVRTSTTAASVSSKESALPKERAAGVGEQSAEAAENEDGIDEDDEDEEMMCLEPQTEMTVEGDDDDDDGDGDGGGSDDSEGLNWTPPPSVTLQPAATNKQQRVKLGLPPSVSITRNPRPVTATITPAGNFFQASSVDREELDRRTREFLDAQNDPTPGELDYYSIP